MKRNGIKPDQYGLRAYVKVGTGLDALQRTKRFKFGEKKQAENWIVETRRELRKLCQRATKDTLRADAKRFLEHQKPMLARSSYRSLVCEIEAWYPELGDTPRHLIDRQAVLDIRHAWLSNPRNPRGTSARDRQPLAPKTCNHRVRALRHLYHYCDGSKAPTPCDDVPKLKEPPANPQFVSERKMLSVAKRLTDRKTRGRFMVLAATGQRPAQLKRAEPGDVNLKARWWKVRPAKGGNPIPIILTDDMVQAWKVFMAADAWGDFDGSDYAKDLYAAGWPKHIRPYNTKHTMAITLAESGIDWEDIKDWFGQKDVKTTRIYTGVVLKRLKATSATVRGRLGWKG